MCNVRDLKRFRPTHLLRNSNASFTINASNYWSPPKLLCQLIFLRTFVLQDAAHWTNSQSTIHPFVIYFKDLSHASFVVISDCLSHNTIAVYLFQKRLISFLTSKLGCLSKNIYYFPDGAASQYKNWKNFVNLCLHNHDFGIKAEWHFSATSHGKGACDGLAGMVKRLAAKVTLQRPYQLYEWASKNIPSVTFVYCTTEEYEREKAFLEYRFQKSHAIVETRSLHAFIPKTTDTMTSKGFHTRLLPRMWR